MPELTPQLASDLLDAWGPPRRLLTRHPITLDAARRYLRNKDHRYRIRAVAERLGLKPQTVARVWSALLRNG